MNLKMKHTILYSENSYIFGAKVGFGALSQKVIISYSIPLI